MPSADTLSYWANWVTIIGFPVSALAFLYAARQFGLGQRTASAGTVIPLNESLRQAWLEFVRAKTGDDEQHAFADITNLLELGCALFHDRLLVGHVGQLLEGYLCNVFRHIERSDSAKQRMEKLLETPDTYKNIVSFLKAHRALRFSVPA